MLYHAERNFSGLGNKIVQASFTPFPECPPSNRRSRLGGRLNYYYREAA